MSRELAALGNLYREHVLNPITALAFYTSQDNGQQYLLAGEDADIKIYHVQTSCFCGQLPIFQAQSIHGISVPSLDASKQPHLILIWGGHHVRVISNDIIEGTIQGHVSRPDLSKNVEARAPDWIFDGRISPFGDGRIVLLTAHNEVIQARVDQDQSSLIFNSIQSPSRPILYSGNFFWVSRECVLVAAGTVFGEIIVWKCYLENIEQKQNCEVLSVFTGHEGSIFGVHISPEIQTSQGETLRLLASCSDDRTIRVWDITERRGKSGHQSQNGYGDHISEARETGFGYNTEGTAHDDQSTRCLAAVMGHASRIWQVEFPQFQPLSETSNIVELYSFGEDATAQKWKLSLDTQAQGPDVCDSSIKPAKLTQQSTASNHSGKHIWSHTMTSNGDDLLIATGGADGKIALMGTGVESPSLRVTGGDQIKPTSRVSDERKSVTWSLSDVIRSSQENHATADPERLNGVSTSLTLPSQGTNPKNAKEGFNRYTFISDSRLLAATNSGRIFVGVFEDGLIWTELTLPDEIGQIIFSHPLLGAPVTNHIALVGTNNGEIYYYGESGGASLQLMTKVNGKVADIFCLSDARVRSGNSHVDFLVTIPRSTNAALIQFDPQNLALKHTEVALELGFMVTAATFTQGYLILGSRKGVIVVLKQGDGGKYSAIFTIEVQRDEAITSLLPLSNGDDQPHNYILSTCRDGRYRIHEILTAASQPNAILVILVHEILLPFVSSIEGAWFSDNGDGTKDLMLCGFRSSNLVVWNETQRHEVATVDCGGSSRSYAWTPLRYRHDGFRFVFTKAGQMHIFSQTCASHKTLKPGGHGREIKAVSASTGRYIATATEDTVIRIWEYNDHDHQHDEHNSNDPRLHCVAALERHATGIQALKWYKNEYLFSSGGNEEFFVWKINQLQCSDLNGLAVVCEAVFPDRTEVGDARIIDFDVTCTARDSDGGYEFAISMVLSNSTLQTYTYSRASGFRLLRRSTYTGACLTQVRQLENNHVLTAATDGYLAIYSKSNPEVDGKSLGDTDATLAVVKLHQNTIKSLDVRQVAIQDDGASEYLIVTGGDDNALGVTHIRISNTPISSSFSSPSSESQGDAIIITIKSKSLIRSAHAAAITGVAFAHVREDSALVVTGSNDQRVRVWRLLGWQQQQQQARVQLLDERYSSVADAGDLDVFGGRDEDGDEDGDGDGEGKGKGKKKVIVVGVGLEIWEVEVEVEV
ncbi:WD40 repeat-like protein [Daldinia decipiens]|uniref:WD40 repeat-like protein n=1 Tax=Daldinia decipiens TaxID=326647 RepID=UPI0020C3A7EE|nr:WD40 repeat-like protein [Daldinia decipiens]KAI1656946.1 WD40 repeat-like protein [Daldinia decipiens]